MRLGRLGVFCRSYDETPFFCPILCRYHSLLHTKLLLPEVGAWLVVAHGLIGGRTLTRLPGTFRTFFIGGRTPGSFSSEGFQPSHQRYCLVL